MLTERSWGSFSMADWGQIVWSWTKEDDSTSAGCRLDGQGVLVSYRITNPYLFTIDYTCAHMPVHTSPCPRAIRLLKWTLIFNEALLLGVKQHWNLCKTVCCAPSAREETYASNNPVFSTTLVLYCSTTYFCYEPQKTSTRILSYIHFHLCSSDDMDTVCFNDYIWAKDNFLSQCWKPIRFSE